jgi:DNA primase
MIQQRRLKFPEEERAKILEAAQETLWQTEGKAALEYLKEKRYLSETIIKRFQLGYCPRNLQHELAGRLIMPVFDAANNLIAFSTRDYLAEKKFQHWHESFDKSNYLYGLNIAKNHMRKTDKAIIVEGQFDTTCLHSHGLHMTVGLMGTSMSLVQIGLLARYCSEIYIVLDPESTGEEGSRKIMEMYKDNYLKKFGLNFINVRLPEELDPDEYIYKYGRDNFVNILYNAKEQSE